MTTTPGKEKKKKQKKGREKKTEYERKNDQDMH